MNNYELTIVLPGDTASSKVKTFNASLEKTISVLKGKIVKVTEWGKIELAYPIKKNNEGVFLHYDLELEPSAVKGLNDKFKLDDDIIRSLLIKKENDKKVNDKQSLAR